MNGGGEKLDERIAAQSERLQNKATPIVAADSAVKEQPKVVAVLSASLLSDGRAAVDLPQDRNHFNLLLITLVAAAIDKAAAAGQQVGAEAAVKAIAANPKAGPLAWFRNKFGRPVQP